jgi:hypothetical protein
MVLGRERELFRLRIQKQNLRPITMHLMSLAHE